MVTTKTIVSLAGLAMLLVVAIVLAGYIHSTSRKSTEEPEKLVVVDVAPMTPEATDSEKLVVVDVAPMTPETTETTLGHTPVAYYGVVSLEELILESDIVARVELLGMSTSTSPYEYTKLDGSPGTSGCQNLNFRFRVNEYLKGSGASEIVAVADTCHATLEQAQATTTMAETVSLHDPQWDSREAIVMLTRSGSQYRLGLVGRGGEESSYQIPSRHSKRWLPAAQTTVGDTSEGESTFETHFLLDIPSTSTSTVSVGSGESGSQPEAGAPTISLAALRALVASIQTELSTSDDEVHRRCLESYYYRVRLHRYHRSTGFWPVVRNHEISSGQPAGVVLRQRFTGFGKPPEDVGRNWFEGPDADIVRFAYSGIQPSDIHDPNTAIRFNEIIETARPVPAGTYEFYFNSMTPWELTCNKYPELARSHDGHRLTVEAPEGVVHEAFFDPVAIGSAVGADGTNGVLKPAGFSLGGVTTTISSLKWENGAVTMGLSPAASLSDYIIDFIDVTGTTTLSLSSDNASTTALTWTVADKPWADGDLLMLRIRPDARPEFATSTYSFSVAEDASTGSRVGTVSATDPDAGDTVSYDITSGNDSGRFSIRHEHRRDHSGGGVGLRDGSVLRVDGAGHRSHGRDG